MGNKYYTVEEAATILNKSTETIRRYIRTGKIKAKRNSRKQGYKIDEFEIHKIQILKNKNKNIAKLSFDKLENIKQSINDLYNIILNLDLYYQNEDLGYFFIILSFLKDYKKYCRKQTSCKKCKLDNYCNACKGRKQNFNELELSKIIFDVEKEVQND